MPQRKFYNLRFWKQHSSPQILKVCCAFEWVWGTNKSKETIRLIHQFQSQKFWFNCLPEHLRFWSFSKRFWCVSRFQNHWVKCHIMSLSLKIWICFTCSVCTISRKVKTSSFDDETVFFLTVLLHVASTPELRSTASMLRLKRTNLTASRWKADSQQAEQSAIC